MRIIGLDVGSKTMGVALSDALKITAQGLLTIDWKEEDISSADEQLKSIIKEYDVTHIVIGLPKHMNGSIGVRGEASEDYAKHCEEVHGISVSLWDERLSTVAAERMLIDADVSRAKRKKVIDKMAAVLILQGYLDQSL